MILATQSTKTMPREVRISVGNDSSEIDLARRQLQDAAREYDACDESDLFRIGMILEESLRNAYVHGNLEVESSSDSHAMSRLLDIRRRTSPYCDRTVEIRACFSPARVVFRITDGGPGFDRTAIKDPTSCENRDREFGRGLLLIEHFADDVEFNERGNSVTLVVSYSA